MWSFYYEVETNTALPPLSPLQSLEMLPSDRPELDP